MKSLLLFFIPLALSAPTPVSNPNTSPAALAEPQSPAFTAFPDCYTDSRLTQNTDVNVLLSRLDADPNGTPSYPWEVTYGTAKIRVNGETKIRKGRAADEARWIQNHCTTGSRVGGLLDMNSHRVRISQIGT